ncbi:chorismate mutase [Francisella adeliensis]|uniref:chorismate mutase n=1 Tax=Francisella adeliensis TaxID=2007306 RepID=A0A2Z4XXK6_9GAMM|nr:chorismate mutase [Francisella adeliensis]AXA33182.1 chorismate mutase [Francisella adeliensis]MBK2085099.1 chorismate mutase [Francisella adeliensis]MBK2096910.1 chorismate mutase [Francisella adeliensis]QIW11410.1 chorismate mutase [Francisella adeliensis]QIW13285.1 chorismate mutase [Francisella adeliensis]
MKLFKTVILAFVVIGVSYAGDEQTIRLIMQRAKLMEGIGVCKLKLNSSLYDAEQEVKVLQNAESIAKKYNLGLDSLLVFIQLQMDLSKQIENYYVINTSKEEANKQSDKCLLEYRDKIKSIDIKLYPSIAKNLSSLVKDKNLRLNLYELSQKNKIKGIPGEPDYLGLISLSIKNIKSV